MVVSDSGLAAIPPRWRTLLPAVGGHTFPTSRVYTRYVPPWQECPPLTRGAAESTLPAAAPRSGGSVRGSPCGGPARLRFTSLRPPPAAPPPVQSVPRFPGRGSAGGQVYRRHTEMCGCRCFLPDLTGFADFRCGGPGRRRTRGRGIKNVGIPARLGTWPSMAIGASGRSIACRKGDDSTGTRGAIQGRIRNGGCAARPDYFAEVPEGSALAKTAREIAAMDRAYPSATPRKAAMRFRGMTAPCGRFTVNGFRNAPFRRTR